MEGPPLKTIEDEVKESETSRFHRWLEARKERMNAHPVLRHLYKPLVIGVGAFCFIAGLIMLVTPGPGWLFIFIGLGIWGTEFTWARRANRFMKHVVLTACTATAPGASSVRNAKPHARRPELSNARARLTPASHPPALLTEQKPSPSSVGDGKRGLSYVLVSEL